jgi:hypothetical protein
MEARGRSWLEEGGAARWHWCRQPRVVVARGSADGGDGGRRCRGRKKMVGGGSTSMGRGEEEEVGEMVGWPRNGVRRLVLHHPARYIAPPPSLPPVIRPKVRHCL